jgi:hypothetical protein
MALPSEGIMPQVMPFQRGLPVTSAYLQNSAIAATHSVTELTWMAQVGRDSALEGSVWTVKAAAAPGWAAAVSSASVPAATAEMGKRAG